VPECATGLILGTASASQNYLIHIKKSNGATWTTSYTTDISGEVILDLEDANEAFYNAHDGLYLIYVTKDGYYCSENKETITSDGVNWTLAGVNFRQAKNSSFGVVTLITQ